MMECELNDVRKSDDVILEMAFGRRDGGDGGWNSNNIGGLAAEASAGRG